MTMKSLLIVVVGPTAVGKTSTAISLAQHYKSAIISSDSRQFYREMEIGTAKPDAEELAMAKHYFVNSHTISEEYDAGSFARDVHQLLPSLFEENPIQIMVGGSGLYNTAVCDGLDDMPTIDAGVREELKAQHAKEGMEPLLLELQRADLDYYEKIDHSNAQRVIRALEVIRQSGKSYSSFRKNHSSLTVDFDIVKIGLELDRSVLYDRINDRMDQMIGDQVEIEQETSHVAADVIFRTLFSIPIEHRVASQVFEAFRAYQRSQPILNLAALMPMPRWMPRVFGRKTTEPAKAIRALITQLTAERAVLIEKGRAPDDLATKIMTTRDPETEELFSVDEMVDQVAIFFLAGHETSASALAWSLYLMALYPEWQERLAQEASELGGCDFAVLSKLQLCRDVFREALRLYPPVPMMVREASCPEVFRERPVKPGAQIVISPWHLHRQTRRWDNPDGFDPARWQSEN